ncbi:neutral/alkaline non-lysosomal ceramidase N-terminal domain-containing protein [Haladaptatus sp. DFWS20]|uniref:neutral/alkaline non-lysosomal ceramidase N-terminal domain-containing protein n=1 Tax=Haladaptatus sp. DFWS20 TaxID=3403467 RepID=UPI003EBC7FA0
MRTKDQQGQKRESSADEPWLIGTARADITPTESQWMAGYAARDAPANGTKTPLCATAVAIADANGREVVFLNVELISIPRALRETVVAGVESEYDLDADAIVCTATHTHSGPILSEVRARIYGIGDEGIEDALTYQNQVGETLITLVGEARADRTTASLSYSHARCGFAINRRLPVEDGIAHVPNPDGPVDHDVPLLVAESDGTPVCMLFGYACHATTLKMDEYCGDWPGYAVDEIERRFPEAIATFLPGCAGDQNPYPRRTLDRAKEQGTAMANAVETAVKTARQPVRGPLRTVYEEPTLKFEGPPTEAEVAAMQGDNDPYWSRYGDLLAAERKRADEIRTEYPYSMHAIGFGTDLTMLALAGEVVVEYAHQLKSMIPEPLWVAAYANDSFTYIPTAQMLIEGGYEGGDVTRFRRYPGRLKPDVEKRVLRHGRMLAERVGSPVQER